jgi:hypothetical protein
MFSFQTPLALNGSSGVTRTRPSLILIEVPFGFTSHRRRKKSAWGKRARAYNVTRTLPRMVSGPGSGVEV